MSTCNSKTLSLLIASIWLTAPYTANAQDPDAMLLQQCSMCHGQDGNSSTPGAPSFGGISETYFRYTLDAYKNKGRESDMMKMLVDGLSAEQIDQLTSYYAKQKYKPADQPFDAALAAEGKILHDQYCAKCHENEGRPSPNSYGILAGQWMPYLQLTLKEYREGKRRVNPMMVTKLKHVEAQAGEKGFEQLVHYYASVK